MASLVLEQKHVSGEFGIEIPESVFGVLAALGLYGVRDAVGKSS